MKVSSKVAEGMVRIDFDANRIQNGKLENVYKYLDVESKISKVIWNDNPLLLSRGIIIGYYNPFITTDDMADLACRKTIKYIVTIQFLN